MENLERMDELPPVSEIAFMNETTYQKFAAGVADYSKFCSTAAEFGFKKFQDWCIYLRCTEIGCTVPQHSSQISGFQFTDPEEPSATATGKLVQATILAANTTIVTVNTSFSPALAAVSTVASNINNTVFTEEGCYDEFNCDPPENARLYYLIFGIVFATVCSASLFSNFVCLVAFNKASNRTGATLYFSAISFMDSVNLVVMMLLLIPRFLHQTYEQQINTYSHTTARLVPYMLPFLSSSELASVWLILCVLVDRYMYLRLGFFSRSVTSRVLHLRVTVATILLAFCYTIPKFFEYAVHRDDSSGRYHVRLTIIGRSTPFRNLMDHLLRVPIEMFLPYLAVGVFTCLAVAKMVDFGSSKWKTVAILCSPSKYRSLGYCCCCGDDFANCNLFRRPGDQSHNRNSPPPPPATKIISSELLDKTDQSVDDPIYYCGIPFEKRSSLMPFYFLVPPPKTETQESANVVIAVCLGFLLLVTKLPRLILHVLTTEHYIEYDPCLVKLTLALLHLVFIALKPMVYLVLGVHFRHALTGLCCCACLYTPVISLARSNCKEYEDGEAGIGFSQPSIRFKSCGEHFSVEAGRLPPIEVTTQSKPSTGTQECLHPGHLAAEEDIKKMTEDSKDTGNLTDGHASSTRQIMKLPNEPNL